MKRLSREQLERAQLGVYTAALLAGAGMGTALPSHSPLFASLITPVLGALLYTTFLQIPFQALRRSVVNRRYLAATVTLNFAVVPSVVWLLARFAPQDRAIAVGVALVLLTPCVDYVIVFTKLGGGDDRVVLASTPVLMLLQLSLLPFLLWVVLGDIGIEVVTAGPVLEAFVLLIVLPLGAAIATQRWATHSPRGRQWAAALEWLPVPLLALTLLTVAAAQVPLLRGSLSVVAGVIPLYAAFIVIMGGLGRLGASLFGLTVREGRALIFSAVTRNSLVVLPLALALEAGYELTPSVVVTQTLVELAGLLILAQAVPRLMPASARCERP
ncbi:MAG: arsenic resistance protein [Chloroflexota bacterium]|nr:arsenic resistance protein [Dehalococcoidia bacterium]MDW8254707.1 arsenic resistance protein [Chloroflexota bacterium]